MPDKIHDEIEKTAKEIGQRQIEQEIRELDKEFMAVIPTVVESTLEEVAKNKLNGKVRQEITEEIILKLNDRANALGSAWIQKKMLRFRGTLIKRAMELANGIRVQGIVKGQPVVYDRPPDKGMIIHLLSYIDGSKAIGFAKGVKKDNESLGDFLNAKDKK